MQAGDLIIVMTNCIFAATSSLMQIDLFLYIIN